MADLPAPAHGYPAPRHRSPHPPRTARPRDPGQRRAESNGPVPVRALLAVALATAVVLGGGLLAVTRLGRSSTPSAIPPATPAADRAYDATLALPLDATTAGLTGGTTQEVEVSQGPAAVSFCRHAPATAGIEAWRGTRITDPAGQRRVVQIVSRFQTAQQASAYLTATSALVDCQSWQTAEKPPLRFTITQSSSARFGEETQRFDLQATSDSSRVFLRTVLFRVGRQVVQLTYASVNSPDLDNLDSLAARAASRVTP